MTTLTRVQIKLQQESGSIFYIDSEDGVIFHIEAMSELLSLSAAEETANNQRKGRTATTDLIKSFLRQHLLKNGESSYSITPLMRDDGLGPLLNAMTALHLRKDAGHGEEGSDNAGAAVTATYKTFGALVSMLQQRERASKAVSHLKAIREDDVEP